MLDGLIAKIARGEGGLVRVFWSRWALPTAIWLFASVVLFNSIWGGGPLDSTPPTAGQVAMIIVLWIAFPMYQILALIGVWHASSGNSVWEPPAKLAVVLGVLQAGFVLFVGIASVLDLLSGS